MTRAPEDLDIYESVVRYQIKTWELAAQTFCIELNGRDADAAFLTRLHPLPVKPASACEEIRVGPLTSIVDKETKEKAVIFDLSTIRRVNGSAVDVEGGYHCANLCWAGGTYHVVRDASGWRVTGFEVEVIT